MKIEVLNKGFVRLVSYMQPAIPSESWTGDLEVVRNARTSYDADLRTGEEDGKDKALINYLYKNQHTSPFEAMVFTFEIKCPIYVARQWHRHRTWAYSEVSARYAELPSDFYVPEATQVGVQHTDNKQMRIIDNVERSNIVDAMRKHNEAAYSLYQELIEQGVPRELARGVLPTCIYTRFFGTVNLNNLFKFLVLRDHSHAQHEIQVYAKALATLIKPIVPYAYEAYIKKFSVESSK